MKLAVKIIFTFLFLSFLIGVCSCSPQKRLNRLVRKHPELVKNDTVLIRDTVFIKKETKDTSFIFNSSKDTIVINEGRLTMKYFYSKDTVFLGGECRDSVIVREVSVPVDRVTVKEELPWWIYALIAGLVLLLLLLIFRRR